MPELPEIVVIARQMDKETKGKRVVAVEVRQPKILNMPASEFAKSVKGKRFKEVSSRGKWLFAKLESGSFLLINLGMGAELTYFLSAETIPENYQFKLDFDDGSGFFAHFWWFGYVHLVSSKDLPKHKMTASLGTSATDESLTLDAFRKLLARKKTGIKTFLLDQKNVAGIGNVYVQDILLKAKLHPDRKIQSLAETETNDLLRSIKDVLTSSIKKGGAYFDTDFYGKRGRFKAEDFLVGYRTGKPCPECGTAVEKVRTGSTSSYICPKCQTVK